MKIKKTGQPPKSITTIFDNNMANAKADIDIDADKNDPQTLLTNLFDSMQSMPVLA